jgi:hypothetical protein
LAATLKVRCLHYRRIKRDRKAHTNRQAAKQTDRPEGRKKERKKEGNVEKRLTTNVLAKKLKRQK